MKETWETVRLGDMLVKADDWIELEPNTQYKEVTVRLWGRGVALRRLVDGAEITGRRLRVRPRQFIASRIDARNGAFGLIPPDLDGAIVTNDFPVFTPREDRLLPEYLGWLSRTRPFVDACRHASEGTTNRVRLKEDKFARIEMPLPPLEEQWRIVAVIERLAGKIEEARGLRFSEPPLSAILDAALERFARDGVERGGWKNALLSDVATVNPRRGALGLSSSDPVSFVPMAALHAETGQITEAETLPLGEVERGHTFFQDGDVVFARITPCMQNGKSAVAEGLVNGVGFGTTEFHVIRTGACLFNRYLHFLVRSGPFRKDAEAHFTGTAGQQRVPESFLKARLIPLPTFTEQRRIVSYLDGLQAKLYRVKALQAQTAAELNALLPAVLDRAFRGKL